MAKKYYNIQSPFRAIEPRNSKEANLLQMTDVILGAIGFHKNRFDKIIGCSPAKEELALYIAKKVGIARLGSNTRYGEVDFKIWNFVPKK